MHLPKTGTNINPSKLRIYHASREIKYLEVETLHPLLHTNFFFHLEGSLLVHSRSRISMDLSWFIALVCCSQYIQSQMVQSSYAYMKMRLENDKLVQIYTFLLCTSKIIIFFSQDFSLHIHSKIIIYISTNTTT